MIRAPHVNHPIEAALEFLQMIGDVGSEIRGLAIIAFDHPILFVAKGAGAKPQRPVFFIDVAGGAQPMQGLVDCAAFLQGAF